MRPRSTTWFPLALIIGLALMSFWLEQAVRGGDSTDRPDRQHDPDFIIENFTTREMNKAGRVDATLSARRMVHFPGSETSELEQPHMVHMQPDRPPVHITADRGVVSGSGEEIELYGNVVVRRLATAAQAELRLETSYLQAFPDQRFARTPAEVLITEGGSRMKGVGMEVNSETGHFQLKSRVSGVYLKPDQ